MVLQTKARFYLRGEGGVPFVFTGENSISPELGLKTCIILIILSPIALMSKAGRGSREEKKMWENAFHSPVIRGYKDRPRLAIYIEKAETVKR